MVTAAIIQEPSFPPLSNKSLIGLIQVYWQKTFLFPLIILAKSLKIPLRQKLALLTTTTMSLQPHRSAL